ncbi:MAG: hypothetical protein ACRD1H_04695 [Vicinamibacterales bacterium]
MPPRTVALIGAVCLLTGWLLASVLTPPVARVQVLPERTQVQPPGDRDALAPYAEQLQLRLREAPPPPSPRRNPFAFGTRQRASSVEKGVRIAPLAADMPVALPVVGPMLSLSGVGVTDTAAGPIYTAVVSDGNTVHLVKAGDTVDGYTVIEVNERSVTLADASGSRYVLRLR